MSTEDKSGLTPEEADLAATLKAMLNAYDTGSDDLRAKMMGAVRRETPDFVVPAEDMARGYAVEGLKADNPGASHDQAVREVRTLDEVSRQTPGIKGLIGLLARRGREVLIQPQKPRGRKRS